MVFEHFVHDHLVLEARPARCRVVIAGLLYNVQLFLCSGVDGNPDIGLSHGLHEEVALSILSDELLAFTHRNRCCDHNDCW